MKIFFYNIPFILNSFAGTPAIIALSGKGLLTTALASISILSPIVIPPKTIAPLCILTLSPIIGTPGYLLLPPPIVTCCPIEQFLPIQAFGESPRLYHHIQILCSFQF